MGTRTSAPRKEIHLRDYLVVLDRYKWLIVAAVIVTMSLMVLYIRRQEPVYEAAAIIMLESNNSGGLSSSLSAFLPGARSDDVATEIVIIKGRTIVERVVRGLGLHLRERKTKQSLISKILRSVGLANEPERDPEQKMRLAVLGLQKNILEVRRQADMTNLVQIKATCDSPEDARDIANKVADEYIQWSDSLDRATWSDLISQMEEKLKQVKADMDRSRKLLHEYEADQGITTAFGSLLIGGESQAGGAGTRYMVPEASQAVVNMKTDIIEMEIQLQTMQKTHSEADPDVISLKYQISANKQKLKQEEEKAIEKYDKQFGLTKLASEVVFSQQLYSTLITRHEELKVQYLMRKIPPKIIERALMPLDSNESYKMLTLMLGGFLGLFLGIGFAFFLKYLENTISTPEDVEEQLGLSVLGVIPQVAEAHKSKQPLLILKGNPKSAPAEAYRSLRTNILFAGLKSSTADSAADPLDHPKTIVITSAGPGEGKSFTTANLGMAMAQAGQKVLLIDADLRRPMIHKVFDVSRANGLSSVLVGEATLEEAVVETDVPNLSVLITGKVPDNPTEILGSVQMAELLQRVKEQYDIVLLDSAPILGMADTVVLASEADAVAIVIKTGAATRKALKLALAQLERVDAQICGVVLNDVDIRRDRYYDYYYSPYEDDAERIIRKRGKRKSSSGSGTTAGS